MRLSSTLFVATVAAATVFVGSWAVSTTAKRPHRGMSPARVDYFADRLTYPTGRLDPRWYVDAAREARAIATRLPEGVYRGQAKVGGEVGLGSEEFTPLGPLPLNAGSIAASGRANVVVVDPVTPNVAYFGSDGGGVWKTTNCCSESTTWEVKTDFPEVSSIAIGDITIDPTNHNVVYAGTGDLRFGSFSFGSAGLLKSTDQGETWVVLGEEQFGASLTPQIGNFPQYQAIGKVVVDPNEGDKIVVGTKTGLFFSYDAGVNWTGPCFTNSFSTQRQDMTGLVLVDEGATTRILAAVGTRGNPTPVQPDLVNNGANGVYRTTMPASGCPAAWDILNNGMPGGTGSPSTTFGRIELAVAPSNPLVVYAMVSNSSTSTVLGVWRSDDLGTSWVPRATSATVSSSGCANAAGGGGQMWYDAGLTVHPTNPEIVYLSGVDLYRSTNGGSNFADLTCGYSGGNVHVDHHARAFVAGDPDRLLLGSDGGIWYSANATAASPTFVPLNSTINTIEFYSGDITADFANAPTKGAAGGAQDNGSNTATWSGAPGPTSWNTRLGGDGIYSRIEPVRGLRWYHSSQNGNLRVSQSGPTGSTVNATAPGTWGGDILSFVMPVEIYRYGVLDAVGSGCTTAEGCTRVLAGTQRVWESIVGGVPTSSWYPTSATPLTKSGSPLGARAFINQLAHAVSDPSVVIVGTNDGNVQMGFGLGTGVANAASWVNLTAANAVLPNRPILDVATDPLNPLVGYAAIGGFNQNTPTTPGHLYRVTCTPQCASFTWEDKTGNLPNIPAASVVANPLNPAQVFVGTDWGLYFTNDITAAAPVWSRHEGLPHVMVWDMAIDRGFTTLAVFTRSRGAWVWPLPTGPMLNDFVFANGFE